MRLAELRTSDGRALLLHPRLAVVEADEQTRSSVVNAISAALRDGGPSAGCVEVHGILLDLDRETMQLLDLDPDLPLVLGAEDLPSELLGPAGPRRARVDDTAAKQRAIVDDRRSQMQEALDVVTAVQAALRAATLERNEAATAFDRADSDCSAALASREAAQRAVDTLSEAAAQDADARDAEADEPLDSLDPEDALEESDSGAADPWAADRLAKEGALAEVEKRVMRARAEVEQAARAANPARLDQADRDALDAVHEAVLEADDRASRRFGGSGARRRLDEARAHERAVLDRLGFDSYSDYLLRSSMGATDPSAELRLDLARTELMESERAFSSARAAADAVPPPPPRPAESGARRPTSRAEPGPPTAVVSVGSESAARLAAATRARDDAATAEARAAAARRVAAGTLADAEVKLVELAVRHDEAEQALAQARIRVDAALADVAQLAQTAEKNGHPSHPTVGNGDSAVNEIDRHLLSWLASRGQHPLADPVPIVLDEVYRNVGLDDIDLLLGRLDRLAESLHVVYMTDDPKVLRWAAAMAPERGGLVALPGRR